MFGVSLRVQSLMTGSDVPRLLTQCADRLSLPDAMGSVGLFRLSGRRQKMQDLKLILDQMLADGIATITLSTKAHAHALAAWQPRESHMLTTFPLHS